MRVYSEIGVGTTFKLFFPAMTTDRAATGPAVIRDVTPTVGARILLVEDEADLRKILHEHLGNAGYLVTSAASGDDGLDRVKANSKIDVVLTDIVLPGQLNGLGLVRELRKFLPDLPVVYMSGYAQEATVHGNGLRPEDIRLTKPISRHALFRAIEMALKTQDGSARPLCAGGARFRRTDRQLKMNVHRP